MLKEKLIENEGWEDPSVNSLAASGGERLLVEKKFVTFPEKFELESGEYLPELTIAYETVGTLNEKKDNAILIIHALTGDAHCCGYHSNDPDEKPGWWDQLIGPGKGIDTNKYFVICSNILGGCSGTTGPTSIDPRTGKRYNMTFPDITFGDMVEAQKKLLDFLGVPKLLSVVGGSMGGMMVLEWARRWPNLVSSIVAIATNSSLSPQAIGFSEIERQAIKLDPKWKNGDYDPDDPPADGLAIARKIAHITYLSQQSMRTKFGRRKQKAGNHESDQFEVESYLDYQGRRFVDRFDANSYIAITEALDEYDLAREGETLDDAVAPIKSLALFLSFRTDWLFPTKETAELVNAMRRLGKFVEFHEIDSPRGHDAFLIEYPKYENLVARFLERVYANYN